MTGFGALSIDDESALEGSAQWAGVAKVLGPPWARLPAVTIGFLGAQVMWSVEMAYGEQPQQSNAQFRRRLTRKLTQPRHTFSRSASPNP